LVFITTTHHPSVGGGYLIALDSATGKTRWQHKMKGYGWSSPIVVGGRVAAFDSNGNLWVRDAATGKNLLDRESFSVGGHVEASPIAFGGKLYIGVRGGALVCVGN
jgi:outer membrane protein assembly factor BamB